MKNIFLITFLLLFADSCVFIRMDDSIDLGNKYRYIQDYPQTIIHHDTKEYEGTGDEVVEPIVKVYKFNNRYIIAKSQEDTLVKQDSGALLKPFKYWIVDKKDTTISVQPMDSVNFYKKLKALRVNLTF